MGRWRILGGIAGVVVLVAIIVSLTRSLEWGWSKHTIQVLQSPNGLWKASVVAEEPAGAVGGLVNEVTVDRVGQVPSAWLPSRQIFISTITNGPLNLIVGWNKDGSLEIAFPADVDVLKHRSQFQGFDIHYQSETLGKPNENVLAAD
jgi:hypothetical protein